MGRLAAPGAVALVILASSWPARADEPSRAETLFQEARALVAGGRYAEACPKLEESETLDPAVGTQFNLADCYEHVGRLATAYAQFSEVARIARAAGKFEREHAAHERAEALAPKLAHLRVHVTRDVPGLEVRLDDDVLQRSAWDTALPIDAGPHRLTAGAPQHDGWRGAVTLADGSPVDVAVPALVERTPPPLGPPKTSSQRTLALAAGGAGLAGLAVMGVAGVVSLSHRSTAEQECPKETYGFRCPTQDGASQWNAATTAGNVATVGLVAGAVLLGAAAVLWLTAPNPTRAGLGPRGITAFGSF
jgi:hypothetical protein